MNEEKEQTEVKKPKVIGVISGKGGVGKTTSVANLGAAFNSKFKRKVAILDGNATTPDLGLHLGMHNFPATLSDVLKKKIPIDKAIYNHASGIKILPSSLSFRKEGIDLRYLKKFSKELEGYEFVFIDSHPGLGEDVSQTLDICDEVLIVTNPELPAITDALRSVEMARKSNTPIRGIILNRVRRERFEISVIEAEAVFDTPIIATVPEDPKVRESIAVGNPIVLNSPNSPAAVGFNKLAARLIGEEYKNGFFARIKRLFRFKKMPNSL